MRTPKQGQLVQLLSGEIARISEIGRAENHQLNIAYCRLDRPVWVSDSKQTSKVVIAAIDKVLAA
jgi:regulator of extracellular matrix RemA (YlzA/DUF370 family)